MIRIESAKKCPFCGCDFITITNKDDYFHIFSDDNKARSASIFLKCKCGAAIHELYTKYSDGGIPSYEKAVEAVLNKWNTRK